MKRLSTFACLLVLLSLPAFGQRGGGARTSARPRVAIPEMSASTTMFLSGKVVVEDGSPLTETASIQTICRGQKRTEAHTDSRGNFSFQFGGGFTNGMEFDADTSSRSPVAGRPERRNLQECELQASLAGFSSDVLSLGGRFQGEESADVGRIVLHRLSAVQGFTISATTAQAPEAARKAFEKGQQQAQKGKWEDAQKHLEKAVALFPRFAVAWFELGRVQLKKSNASAARHSFEQAIAADSKYVSPYHALTQISLHDRNWRELVEFSEKLLALNPISFPDVWLSNSLGYYCLENWAASEKSARRGLEIDVEHHVPKLEYMLGIALVQKPDYPEASRHLRAFLTMTTKQNEITETQAQLNEIARLTASASLPSQK